MRRLSVRLLAFLLVLYGCGEESPAAPSLPTLAVVTTAVPAGRVGTGYDGAELAAQGGDGSYSWTVASGALPTGLSLSTGGLITGTATGAGTFDFTVTARSGDGQTAQRSLSITVYGVLVITTSSLPNGVVDADYGPVTLAASGGDGTHAWSVDSGSLPEGLSVSAAGEVSGIPTAPGASTFTVSVASGDGQTAQATLSISAYQPLLITTATLPTGVRGSEYGEATIAATGGDGTYTWAVAAGSLPTGLTLSEVGEITGAPTETGVWDFTLEATSGDGQTRLPTLSIVVYAPLVVTTSALSAGVKDADYGLASLAGAGGDGDYTWTLASGTLPDGLGLSDDGDITGTPTDAGTHFTVRVTSGDGQTAEQPLWMAICSLEIGPRCYETIVIGTQTWMVENLNFETPSDSWYYANSASYQEYGRLYTWDLAQSLAPAGWHLPSQDDWEVLVDYLGGSAAAGAAMKETGTAHWWSPNPGTNSSGFTALGGGVIDSNPDGRISNYIDNITFWWTSTPSGETNHLGPMPFLLAIVNGGTGVIWENNRWNTDGLSVRYVKD